MCDNLDDELIEENPNPHDTPVNSDNTLMGALRTLAEKISTNLANKNVTLTNNEGLTTLANKILEIEPDFTNAIYYIKEFDKESYTYIPWDNTNNWQLNCQIQANNNLGGIYFYFNNKILKIYKKETEEAYCIELANEYIKTSIPLTNEIKIEVRKTNNNLEIILNTTNNTYTKTLTTNINNINTVKITQNNATLKNILITNA